MMLGLWNSRLVSDNETFFFMDKAATQTDYTSTSTAYNLQAAVTVYFVYWGYQFGWSNIFFVITWSAGLVLFSLAMPNFSLWLKNKSSLFDAISNESRSVRVLFGSLFSLALIGIVYGEVFFASQFFSTVTSSTMDLSTQSTSIVFWMIFFFFLGSIGIYTSIGGIAKLVSVDKIQLSVAVVSLSIFFAAAAPSIALQGEHVFFWLYIPIVVLLLLFLIGPMLTGIFLTGGDASRFGINQSPLVFSAGIISLVIVALTMGVYWPASDIVLISTNFPKPIGTMLAVDYGIWPIIGFGIANLLWQFSDYTSYHRLAILQNPNLEAAKSIQFLRGNILSTAITSPITWSFGILIGMTIDASGDVGNAGFGAFMDYVSLHARQSVAGDIPSNMIICSLGIFMISVFLCSADSGVIMLGLLILRDISSRFNEKSARTQVIVFLMLALLVMAAAQSFLRVSILEYLNLFYSFGLVFAPITLYVMFSKRVRTLALVASSLSGAAAGLFFGLQIVELPSLVQLIISTTSAIAVSAFVVGLFWLLDPGGRQPISISPMSED
jgi:hypothetical protein